MKIALAFVALLAVASLAVNLIQRRTIHDNGRRSRLACENLLYVQHTLADLAAKSAVTQGRVQGPAVAAEFRRTVHELRTRDCRV